MTAAATPRISLLLPTRGRLELARRFLTSLVALADRPDALEVVLYVDDDDQTSARLSAPGAHVVPVIGPRATMGAANSACLARATGEIVMLANDDIVVHTRGWDTELRAVHDTYPDGVYLAWVNDGFKRGRMSTFPVLSRAACAALGDPYPAAYRSAFIDYELFDVFTRLRHAGHDRLVYLDRVVFEHLHHRAGKREFDETARRHRRFEDDWTFLARGAARQWRADRLRAAIEGRTAPPAPAAHDVPAARGAVGALRTFATTFFGDRGLPFGRRVYLFTWYCGRYAAARST